MDTNNICKLTVKSESAIDEEKSYMVIDCVSPTLEKKQPDTGVIQMEGMI